LGLTTCLSVDFFGQAEIDPFGEIENGKSLSTLPKEYKENYDVAMFAIEVLGPSEIRFVSDKLKGNSEFWTSILSTQSDYANYLVSYIPDTLFSNEAFVQDLYYSEIPQGSFLHRVPIDLIKNSTEIQTSTFYASGEKFFLKYIYPFIACDSAAVMNLLNNGILIELVDDSKFYLCSAVRKNELLMKQIFNEIGGDYFYFASDELKKNQEYILENLESSSGFIYYADTSLLNNNNFLLKAIEIDPIALSLTTKANSNSKDFIQDAVKVNALCVKYAKNKFQNDESIMGLAIDHDLQALQYIGRRLLRNENFMNLNLLTKIIKEPYLPYNCLHQVLPSYRNNVDAISLILKSEPFDFLLHHIRLSKSILRNDDIVSQLNNRKVLFKTKNKTGFTLRNIPTHFKNDTSLFNNLFSTESHLYFKYASKQLKDDKTFVLQQIPELYPWIWGDRAFYWELSRNLKSNPEIIHNLLKYNGGWLEHVKNKYAKDSVSVLIAVGNDGYSLQYANSKLRKNELIVRTAVKQYGESYFFADRKLKSNKNIIKESLLSCPKSIRHLDKKLLQDSSTMNELMNINPACYFYLESKIQNKLNPNTINSIYSVKYGENYDSTTISKNDFLYSKGLTLILDSTNNHLAELKNIKIKQFKIDLNGQPFRNGRIINCDIKDDYFNRKELSESLTSGDEIIIHSIEFSIENNFSLLPYNRKNRDITTITILTSKPIHLTIE